MQKKICSFFFLEEENLQLEEVNHIVQLINKNILIFNNWHSTFYIWSVWKQREIYGSFSFIIF